MYHDLFILLLLVFAIMSVCKCYNEKQKEQHEQTQETFKTKKKIRTKIDNQKLDNIIECQDYNNNKSDYEDDEYDGFLYSEKAHDIIYGEGRDKESHCACEVVIDDTYYEDDNEIIPCDNEPIYKTVDKYNEFTRYMNDEIMEPGFDGVYHDDMYNIEGKPSETMGYTTFATY